MLNKLGIWQILLFLCWSSAALPQHYGQVETTLGSPVNIELSSPFNVAPLSGFIPVRARIQNDYSFKQTWSLTSISRVSGKSFMRYSKTLQVPANSQRHFDLAIPIGVAGKTNTYGYHVVNIAGPGVKSAKLNLSSYATTIPILSKELYSLLRSEIEERAIRTHGADEVLELNMEQLPRSWIALTGFGKIAITATEFNSIEKDAQNELLDWTATGGTLVLVHDASSEMPQAPLNTPGPYGFGEVYHQLTTDFFLDTYIDNSKETRHKLIEHSSTKDISNLAPHPADTLPARLLVILYFISVAVASLKTRSSSKTYIKLGVPIIFSFIFTGAIVVSLALMAGFGARGSLYTLALIHQGRSHTLQHRVMRSGLLLDRSFQNASNSSIVPVELPEIDGSSIYHQSFYVEDSQHYGDWFRSGQLSHFLELQDIPLARTLLVKPGTNPTVYSRLPEALPAILYRQHGDSCFIAHDVPSGETTSLKPITCNISKLISNIPEPQRSDVSETTWILNTFLRQENAFLAFARSLGTTQEKLIPFASWEDSSTVILGLGNAKDDL
jgi:hypothetical protein